MTPKEKAQELYDKHFLQTEYHISLGDDQLAIQTALLCVDETYKTLVNAYPDTKYPNTFIEYWQEVKKEIEAF